MNKYLYQKREDMAENKFDSVKQYYPDVIVVSEDGKESIDFEKLALILVDEVADLQDQIGEKDYQILNITKQIDLLKSKLN